MEAYEHPIVEGETGIVVEAKGYLLRLEGLPSVRVDNIIVNARGQRALVTALHENSIEALLLDPGDPEAGERFVLVPEGIQYSFGTHLFGRVLNALGEPIDDLGRLPEGTTPLRLEAQAPTMSARDPLASQLFTGAPAVDILVPIAKGQRQLIIGPTSSGKNIFLESVIASQTTTETVCIYAYIGRPVAYVEDSLARLFGKGGNPNTIALVTFSDEPAPMIMIAPAVALELAESFSWEGKDVLLVLDDLGSHAKYLREVALLSGQVPGRESYPGDMFFQQARLLERGGVFNRTLGGGSITILPVLETNIEDISGLISTNLVSATDGHLFFSPTTYAEGYFPAVIPDESVTRVGRKTQSSLMKQLSIRIQVLLANYERERRYSQFGTQLSKETRHIISQGEIMRNLLNQEPMTAVAMEVQIILLALVFTSFFDGKDVAFVNACRGPLVEAIMAVEPDQAIEPVVTSARRGSIELDTFLRKLTTAVPHFETICRQQ